MKRLKITISLLLILSFLLSAMPTLAADAGEITTESIVEESLISEETTVTESTPEVEATILREEESLRGKYEKHFLMSDGTYQAVVYNEPIHYETDSGWVEVDNTLRLSTAKDGTSRYTTSGGFVDVSFAPSTSEQLVAMSQGEYSLAWSVAPLTSGKQPAAAAKAELAPVDRSAYTLEEQKTLALKSTSTLRYRNAFAQGADLEYIVLPSRVKENIILNSKQDISAYVITVQVENLTAQLQENREILFLNPEKEVVFTMTAPYMYDSAGEFSEDIAVTMTATARDTYTITMTPDKAWLNDESRVYPITIDPQVTTSSDPQNIIDNYVMANSGVQNYTLDRLLIGKRNGNKTRAYIKFSTMPTIPSGSVFIDAQMTCWLTTGQSTGNTASAYMVTGGDWSSTTISWANMPAATTLLQSNISHNNLTKYTFSCLTAVKHWYTGMPNGKFQNYGIMLQYYREAIEDYNPIYSADHTTASQRPSLTITYQSTPGEITIREGATFTIQVDSSSTVTWTSSNTAVATVSSSGVVTGIAAGKATITATANGTTLHTSTFYVKLQDGVYRIKNNAANYYVGTSGSIAEGTQTKLVSKTSAGPAQLYQLWKITYLDTGYYSIRPMYKLDMALSLNLSNATLYTIGTTDTLSAVPATSYWEITADSLGYALKYRASSGTTLAPSGDNPVYGAAVVVNPYSSTNLARHWTLEWVGNPPAGTLIYSTLTQEPISTPAKSIAVGATKTLSNFNFCATAYAGDTNSQTVYWYSSDPSVATVNRTTGAVTGTSEGITTITASLDRDGSYQYASYTLYVSKLLIYQTVRPYFTDGQGNEPEDLTYGDLSENDLRALDWVNWSDFAGYTANTHREKWSTMCISLFAKGELCAVILDMIDHFMDGDGTSYSNSVLTQHAYEHDSTQNYITNVEEQIGVFLSTHNGDISTLLYTASNRGSNDFAKYLDNCQPKFITDYDAVHGLKICVNDLWGSKIEVSSYNFDGDSYSCTLHYTLYDHFGLDQHDVEKYGYLGGFRSWYVLQHYDGYNEEYQPFLTLMEFDVTLTGTIS